MLKWKLRGSANDATYANLHLSPRFGNMYYANVKILIKWMKARNGSLLPSYCAWATRV
jgi:hypothetical protein